MRAVEHVWYITLPVRAVEHVWYVTLPVRAVEHAWLGHLALLRQRSVTAPQMRESRGEGEAVQHLQRIEKNSAVHCSTVQYNAVHCSTVQQSAVQHRRTDECAGTNYTNDYLKK